MVNSPNFLMPINYLRKAVSLTKWQPTNLVWGTDPTRKTSESCDDARTSFPFLRYAEWGAIAKELRLMERWFVLEVDEEARFSEADLRTRQIASRKSIVSAEFVLQAHFWKLGNCALRQSQRGYWIPNKGRLLCSDVRSDIRTVRCEMRHGGSASSAESRGLQSRLQCCHTRARIRWSSRGDGSTSPIPMGTNGVLVQYDLDYSGLGMFGAVDTSVVL